MSSKNKWKENQSNRFINPYNFVPLAEKCERSKLKIDYKDSHTGVLECSLEILTPLFIPNTTSDTALHTKEELEIREESSESLKTHSYDFFSYNDLSQESKNKSYEERRKRVFEPVIPASEIRGAVRSVHEAAFGGCMSSISIDRKLGRRTALPKKCGILRKVSRMEGGISKEQWLLYPCRRIRVKVSDKEKGNLPQQIYDECREGEAFYINCKSKNGIEYVNEWKKVSEGSQGNLKKKAYLHKGEPFGGENDKLRKEYESFFLPDKKIKEIPVDDKEVENLRSVIHEYQKGSKDTSSEPHSSYERYDIDEIIADDPDSVLPVYYLDDEKENRHFSPACIGKEVFYKTMENILDDNGDFRPCKNGTKLCPTCKIFGMAGEKQKEEKKEQLLSIASRVRFTDAVLENAEKNYFKYFEEPIILPELGEPRPGAVEFYTYPPYDIINEKKELGWNDSNGYWTYDYYVIKDGDKSYIRKSLGNKKIKIRGRKFYWHSDYYKKISHDNKSEEEKVLSSMRQRIRPLRSNQYYKNKFKCKIYFENLTLSELKQLKWAVDFNDRDCAHKIGKAKPYGFGSVRICVDNVKIRTIDMRTGEWKLEPKKMNLELEDSITERIEIKNLKMIANWEKRLKKKNRGNRSEKVSYPLGYNATERSKDKNKDAGHQWFNGNRTMPNDSRNDMNFAFHKLLPTIEEELEEKEKKKWLYKLEKK